MAQVLSTWRIRSASRLGEGLSSQLRCGEQVHRRRTRQLGFRVGNLALVWVQDGAGILRLGRRAHALRPGDAFFRWPGRPHDLLVEDHLHTLFVAVPGPALLLLRDLGLSRLGREPVIHPGLDADLAGRWRQTIRALDEALPLVLPRIGLEALGLIVDLALRAQGRSHPAAAQVAEACRLLDRPGRTGLGAVAAHLGMGVSTLRRHFTEVVGLSPWAWHLRRRVDRARDLLVQDDRPIAAIAAACGFTDAADFSRRFKREVGLSPRAWRKRNN